MALPNNPSNNTPGDRQHRKFNRDVLPDFKRRPDSWEDTSSNSVGEKMSNAETDSILKWFGLGIMLLVVGAIVGVTLQKRGATAEEKNPNALSVLDSVNEERELAKKTMIDYMGTKDLESRLRYARRPEAVRPLMEGYFQENEIYPLKVWNVEQVEPRSIDGYPFWYGVVNTPEGREILLLEKTAEGFKVDWETHVGLNPMSPEDFVRERPAETKEFRVYASPVEYYNGPFSDPEKNLSTKLEFANSGVVLYGYIDRTSPDYTRFLNLVDGGGQVPLILALKWPEGSTSREGLLPQVAISELVSERWLVIE